MLKRTISHCPHLLRDEDEEESGFVPRGHRVFRGNQRGSLSSHLLMVISFCAFSHAAVVSDPHYFRGESKGQFYAFPWPRRKIQ